MSSPATWLQPSRSALRLCAAALICVSLAPAWGAETLDDILAKLDRSAAGFKGMKADLTQTAHTAVVDENQVENGTIRMRRAKPGDTRMLVDFTHPDAKTVLLQDGTLKIYLPNAKTVQQVDLGNQSSIIEQFLLLGFGTTRKDLAAANDVSLGGIESVRGQQAARLVLKPKSKDLLQHVEKIELWLNPETGYPLQHKIYQPGGDYQLFSFNNLVINPPDLTDASLKLKLPKDVKTEVVRR